MVTRLSERIYRTEGIVLRQMELGEADRILTFYTPQYGKLRAMAKGIRRPASKLRGHLELFTRTKLMLARGRNLDVITGAETIEPFRGLRSADQAALDLIGGAYRIAERLDRLTEDGSENRAIWDLLVGAMGALSDGVPPRMVTLHFDLLLLGYLGYQPNLDTCAGCGNPLEPIENRYSFELGGVLCPDCRSEDPAAEPLSINALKLLRLMARQDVRVVARLRLPEGLLEELEGLLNRSVRLTTDRDFAAPAVLRSLHTEG